MDTKIPEAGDTRHATRENGDCAPWCGQCRDDRIVRDGAKPYAAGEFVLRLSMRDHAGRLTVDYQSGTALELSEVVRQKILTFGEVSVITFSLLRV